MQLSYKDRSLGELLIRAVDYRAVQESLSSKTLGFSARVLLRKLFLFLIITRVKGIKRFLSVCNFQIIGFVGLLRLDEDSLRLRVKLNLDFLELEQSLS